jgi:DtxR family transcriptional regulator, Mn-dependent transcriptional regulator
VRREKTSVSQEDYLKAIWDMLEEEEVPISARVAEMLGVTPPAVTAALKRMTRDGYLLMGRDGRIRLTAKGRSIAQHLALRHQLAEKLLTEIIGLDWAKAHEEAERLEHGISPEVERLLLARFGADQVCPHGVPLIGGLAKLRRSKKAVQLGEIPAGSSAEILCVYERDPKFLEFLDGLGLKPGVRLHVESREYDQTMLLRTNGKKIHLGGPAASRIWVRFLRHE